MPYYKKVAGPRCYLSPCILADAEHWARWENDFDVALPLGDEAYQICSLEKAREFVAEAISHQSPVFTIVENENDRPIGRGVLFNINHVDRKAMLGILIGEADYRGRGYGTEAVQLLLQYAFNLLNLNSVSLGVFEFNPAALRCYEKVGFKIIGRQRQGRILGNARYDVILMDILAEEFTCDFGPES
jgi:RimJ/RimL family protein N-acetyltransferase